MHKFILLGNQGSQMVDIEDIASLKQTLSDMNPITTKLVLITDKGCMDIGEYMLEKSPLALPDTIDQMVNNLVDRDYDGYSTPNPLNTKDSSVQTYGLAELDGVEVQLTNVEHPDIRLPIIEGQDEHPDLVLTTDRTDIDLSSLFMAVGGKIKPTLLFNNELFIRDAAFELHDDNYTMIDFSAIGGVEKHELKDLYVAKGKKNDIIYVSLPDGEIFEHKPIIVLRGKMLFLPDAGVQILTANTLSFSVEHLKEAVHDEILEYEGLLKETAADLVIDKWIKAKDSMVLVPKSKWLFEKFTLQPESDRQFSYKSFDYGVYGICMYGYNNHITPYIVLPSEAMIKNKVIQHMVFVPPLPKRLDTCETDIAPDQNHKMNKELNPSSRVDLTIVKISSYT